MSPAKRFSFIFPSSLFLPALHLNHTSYLSLAHKHQSLKRLSTEIRSATSDIDVDGGLLSCVDLQADVATHLRRVSPANGQCGHAINLFLPSHPQPVLPLPLHLPLALAMQIKWLADVDDNVVSLSGDDRGFAVACNNMERK